MARLMRITRDHKQLGNRDAKSIYGFLQGVKYYLKNHMFNGLNLPTEMHILLVGRLEDSNGMCITLLSLLFHDFSSWTHRVCCVIKNYQRQPSGLEELFFL